MSYETALPTTNVRGRQKKLTPERIQQIKDFVQSGVSSEAIAAAVGVTVGTLKVSCSKLGISLRRPRLASGNGRLPSRVVISRNMDTSFAAKFTVLVRCHGDERGTELPLTTAMIGRLGLEAASRDLTISELAGDLIVAVAKQGLVQRVLKE
jgi:hypothetical protein